MPRKKQAPKIDPLDKKLDEMNDLPVKDQRQAIMTGKLFTTCGSIGGFQIPNPERLNTDCSESKGTTSETRNYVSNSKIYSDCCGKEVETESTEELCIDTCKGCGNICLPVYANEWKGGGKKPKDYSWVLRRIVDVLFILLGCFLTLAFYEYNYVIHENAAGDLFLFLNK